MSCRIKRYHRVDFFYILLKQGRGQGGLGGAKPSQPLKLASKHDGCSSATYELPQKIFACWRFSHVPVLLSREHQRF